MRALAFVLLAGCLDTYTWGPGAVLDPGDDPRWAAQIELAASIWGCLTVAPGGHPVLLVENPDWGPTVGGRFDGESVQVLAGLGQFELPVLLHELGHALGHGHTLDDTSIMYENGVLPPSRPNADDLKICE